MTAVLRWKTGQSTEILIQVGYNSENQFICLNDDIKGSVLSRYRKPLHSLSLSPLPHFLRLSWLISQFCYLNSKAIYKSIYLCP